MSMYWRTFQQTLLHVQLETVLSGVSCPKEKAAMLIITSQHFQYSI